MGITESKHHGVLSLQLGAIADADNFQLTRPALGDAFHGVAYQSAYQTMYCGPVVAFTNDVDVAVLGFQFHARRQVRLHGAFRPLDDNGVALNFILDALSKRNRFSSNTSHSLFLL